MKNILHNYVTRDDQRRLCPMREFYFMKNLEERFLVKIAAFLFLLLLGLLSARCVLANYKPKVKAKFYDFSEQLIDGQVKKPQALYTDVRQAAKFDKLLRLKRSFLPKLLSTAKDPVLK